MKSFRKLMRGEKGFTLIELLVVIAILGAIAGIVILNVSQFIGRGRCEGYCTEKHNVITACVAAATEGVAAPETNYGAYLIGGISAGKFTWTVSGNCTGASGVPVNPDDDFAYATECDQCPN